MEWRRSAIWTHVGVAEEVGSVSAYGAESNFIESAIERVAVALNNGEENDSEAYQRALAQPVEWLRCKLCVLGSTLASLVWYATN